MTREREISQFGYVRNRKKDGTRAFVGRPNKGAGANRSVVLVGSESDGWFQAVKCWNGNHLERAQAFADEYNKAPSRR